MPADTGDPDGSGQMVGTTELRVEYESAPINVPVTGASGNADSSDELRFSWRVTGPRRTRQSACQILVADDPEDLSPDRDPKWDSGVVESDASTAVEYAGPALRPDETYHWTVRVRDTDGDWGNWSDRAQFDTALSDRDDHWEGSWIGAEYDERELVGTEWTDYELEVEFTIDGGAAGFAFRVSSAADLYVWKVHAPDAETDARLTLHVREGEEWEIRDEVDVSDAYDDADRHTIRIDVVGTDVRTWLDRTAVDVRADDTHGTGTVGFWQRRGEDVCVHSIRVRDTDGKTLFADDFDAPTVREFAGGVVKDGSLVVRGADDPADLVLHAAGYHRPAPLLRREFELSKPVDRARLHVSAGGYCDVHINGERAGERVLDPGMSDYEETIFSSTYDVTDHLRRGENVVGVALGRARYGELLPNVWNWHDPPWWGDPRFLLQLNVEFVDGTTASIYSDDEWALTDGPTRFDSLFRGEVYDARRERSGWTTPEYDDADWDAACALNPPSGDVVPQRVQPVKVMDTLEPVDVSEVADGVYVFDLGQIIAGWAELTVEGEVGTTVTLTLGEKLHDDGTVDVGTGHMIGPIQTDQYVLSGDGVESWEPRFTYKGLRYVQVEGFPGEPTPEAITGKVVHTAIEADDESDFACSNEMLAQIHENFEWAYCNNHHSIPTDTPKYEKNGWTGDAQVTAESGLYDFSMPRLYEKWLRDVRDTQHETGELSTIAPTSDWSLSDGARGGVQFEGPIPGWDITLILVPWWTYQFTGDRRILVQNYEAMKRYLRYLGEHADEHILRVGLGDWAQPPEGPAITSTGYYYRGAQVLSRVAHLVGTEADAQKYAALADEIRAAFNDAFLDESAGVYRTGETDEYRQTSNLFPLAFGVVPSGHQDAVVENLVTNVVETNDDHLNTRTLGTKYLLPVLTEYGHHDVAYRVANQTTHPSWGNWVVNGCTSMLEFWPLDARSWDHHFLGSIEEWFYRYLAGIDSVEPGFRHVEVAPKPVGDLVWVDATVDTVRGPVESRWERDGDRLSLDVSIPGNTSATVVVPVEDSHVRLLESGTKIWDVGYEQVPLPDGVLDVEHRNDGLAVEVGSGKYEFDRLLDE